MDIEESDEFDTDLEDGEESSAESEAEEKRRAPDELKMEVCGGRFLDRAKFKLT